MFRQATDHLKWDISCSGVSMVRKEVWGGAQRIPNYTRERKTQISPFSIPGGSDSPQPSANCRATHIYFLLAAPAVPNSDADTASGFPLTPSGAPGGHGISLARSDCLVHAVRGNGLASAEPEWGIGGGRLQSWLGNSPTIIPQTIAWALTESAHLSVAIQTTREK